jgi:hypothetical protein
VSDSGWPPTQSVYLNPNIAARFSQGRFIEVGMHWSSDMEIENL